MTDTQPPDFIFDTFDPENPPFPPDEPVEYPEGELAAMRERLIAAGVEVSAEP